MIALKEIIDRDRVKHLNLDVLGRISNINLPFSKGLFPLFEAVTNSIHAIQERGAEGRGEIIITVERGPQETIEADDYELRPIEAIIIEDNGIGFNEKNFLAFLTADTTNKAHLGGKGIGRFVWLKAFEKVHIESTYTESGQIWQRSFDFLRTEKGVENNESRVNGNRSHRTTVSLLEFDERYQASCPKKTDVIALRILQHTLFYFLGNNCPSIILRDGGKTIRLNDLFAERIKGFTKKDSFRIKMHDFEITHLHMYATDDSRHQIHYCADNREVRRENISTHIPDLSRKLRDEDGNSFVYSSYVSGDYLDARVNSERTDFNFPDDTSQGLYDEITRDELNRGIVVETKSHLKPFLEKIHADKMESMEKYIRTKAPQYRPLLKYETYLSEIAPDLPEERLDLELHKAKSRLELTLKEKSQSVLSVDPSKVDDIETYRAQYDSMLEEINELGKSQLAQYIVHRKFILDLLERRLEIDKDSNRYQLEQAIHGIVFPLRNTSDEIDYEKQNLWLIDEKLSYHNYLASDIPFNKMTPVSVGSRKRPDIAIFNEPFAFVEHDAPFGSVVIIEFKRPVRDDYSDNENPIDQVLDYVRKIKAGDSFDKTGRPISIPKDIPFYVYIMCDLLKNMRKFAENASLIATPDNMGYFGYNAPLTTYVEIISYDKLMSDAKKRNRVLFDKLFL